jgi:hypothetical protein
MAYDIRNVFYLGNTQEYAGSTAAGKEWVNPIDVSAYVDPISKGRAKGQGLAVYKVHCSMQTDHGTPLLAAETASLGVGLSVKPYTTTGDAIDGVVTFGDMVPASDLLIYGTQFIGQASGEGNDILSSSNVYCEPSIEVPYVVVRDTIFQIAVCNVGVLADIQTSFRMECAMITLDTATLNQLLRTQTA